MLAKLLEVQREIGAIGKDSVNPFYHSKYFDINKLLEVVKPVLSKHGLVLLQPLDGDKLKTLIIDPETDKQIESTVNLPDNSDPQKRGSIITYFRRYSLQSLLALQAEDDDANAASTLSDNEQKTPLKDHKIDAIKNWSANLQSEKPGPAGTETLEARAVKLKAAIVRIIKMKDSLKKLDAEQGVEVWNQTLNSRQVAKAEEITDYDVAVEVVKELAEEYGKLAKKRKEK